MQGINIRPSMDIETIEIEDTVLPDGNHVHKEKHMKDGVESVQVRSDRPMSQEDIMGLMQHDIENDMPKLENQFRQLHEIPNLDEMDLHPHVKIEDITASQKI